MGRGVGMGVGCGAQLKPYGIYEREPGLATGIKSYSSDVRYVVPSSDERVVS